MSLQLGVCGHIWLQWDETISTVGQNGIADKHWDLMGFTGIDWGYNGISSTETIVIV